MRTFWKKVMVLDWIFFYSLFLCIAKQNMQHEHILLVHLGFLQHDKALALVVGLTQLCGFHK